MVHSCNAVKRNIMQCDSFPCPLFASFHTSQYQLIVSQVLPLEEAKEAHEMLETNHTRGKIILRM